MRVKICGITTVQDALGATEAGADALGLNFVSGPRRIDPDRAEEILRTLPPFVTPVALVRIDGGRLPVAVADLLARSRVAHVQLYGQVTADCLADLTEHGLRPMPVLAVRDASFAAQVETWHVPGGRARAAAAVILDAFDPQREGGTGTTFRWDWVTDARRAGQLDGWPPLILAGGLHPGNVADAVRMVQPYGVDVSSGVEVDGLAGRKDPEKMRQFVHNAKHAAKR